MISFSADLRDELARIEEDKTCCRLAELASLVQMGGNMIISGGRVGLNFKTENASVARKVFSLIKNGYGIIAEVMVSQGRRLKKKNNYLIRIPPAVTGSNMLLSLGINSSGQMDKTDLLMRSCCRKAFLRGAFLGGGSINRPEGDYHLELVSYTQTFATTIQRVLRTVKLRARQVERKNRFVVYLKDAESIISFIRLTGANNALLAFENIRVMRDMRGRVNRLVNCETANLQRTVEAAIRQVEKIRFIKSSKNYYDLPAEFIEVAELRIANPEASLQELVDIAGGKIKKSTVSYRLRKLEAIADEIIAVSNNLKDISDNEK